MQRLDRTLAISAVALGTLAVCLTVLSGKAWEIAVGAILFVLALVIVATVARRML